MNASPIEIVLEDHATPDQEGTYLHIPFDMPENIERIDVRYEYSDQIGSDPHLKGGNTVDIGIFDARGIVFNNAGFRGWSGSARSEFFITHVDSTPGYMPGPLQAGTWYISLGLYKVHDVGCDYKVTIRLHPSTQETAPVTDFPALLPLHEKSDTESIKSNGWYKGELHCHTINSDGDSTPAAIVKHAESLGLDFLAVTDHNALTHQIALNTIDTPLMLIPGLEVTTYHGHWNVWGDKGWIDFRINSEDQMRQSVDEALRRGYLVSCNHPRPYGPPWEYPSVDHFNCIEVWNGPWKIFNDASLAVWEEHLRAGRRYTAVGGSDAHFLNRDHIARLGHPTNYIYCEGEPSPAKLLESLRKGHNFITDSPTGPQLMLTTEIDDQQFMMGDQVEMINDDILTIHVHTHAAQESKLQLISAQGVIHEVPVDEANWQTQIQVNTMNARYIRAQLVQNIEDTLQIRALTNPIYIVNAIGN